MQTEESTGKKGKIKLSLAACRIVRPYRYNPMDRARDHLAHQILKKMKG